MPAVSPLPILLFLLSTSSSSAASSKMDYLSIGSVRSDPVISVEPDYGDATPKGATVESPAVIIATMKLAAEARLPVLRDMCVSSLFAIVDTHNVVDILTAISVIGTRYLTRFDKLRSKCMTVLLEGGNFRMISATEKFKKFMHDAGDIGVECMVDALGDDVLPHPLQRRKREGLKDEINEIDKMDRQERNRIRNARLAECAELTVRRTASSAARSSGGGGGGFDESMISEESGDDANRRGEEEDDDGAGVLGERGNPVVITD
jgi:hypothetical protein